MSFVSEPLQMACVQSVRSAVRSAIVAAFALTAVACERVVDITVPTGPTRLVVQARLESRRPAERGGVRTPSPQRLRLTTTAPYFDNQLPPPARGAVVRVAEAGGGVTTFRESPTTPGEYVADDLVLTVGARYTLQIDWQGDRYESTETMQSAVAIDSLYFAPRQNRSAETDGLRGTLDVRDPENEANYYLWEQSVDGVPSTSADSSFNFRAVASDEFYNGRRVVSYQPYLGVRVRPGQLVRIRQYALSTVLYQYYLELNNEVGGDGSPFSLPVASVRGNVVNRSAPARRALGYFTVSEYSEQERVVR